MKNTWGQTTASSELCDPLLSVCITQHLFLHVVPGRHIGLLFSLFSPVVQTIMNVSQNRAAMAEAFAST